MSKTPTSDCKEIDCTQLVHEVLRRGRGDGTWRATGVPNLIFGRIWCFAKPLPRDAPENALFTMQLYTEAKVFFSEKPWLWRQDVLIVSAPIRGRLKPDDRHGGFKNSFLCPECRRPMKKLYLYPASAAWKCRVCLDLCYDSQRELSARLKRALATGGLDTARAL